MIEIVNSLSDISRCYPDGEFRLDNWQQYIEEVLPGHSDLFIRDMQDMCGMGDFSYEEDVLPVLNACIAFESKLQQLNEAFGKVVCGLEDRIQILFGKAPEATILLYLGLCNGAGWVEEIEGKPYILLGIEKIIELDWCDEDSLNGLIYHELGHLYHRQFGRLEDAGEGPDYFLGQLFSEGIVQYFEANLVGDDNYFHQDTFGWLMWCDIYRQTIKEDFNEDLPEMTLENQCYFGDWVDYNGKADVGYYLGARFVQWIAKEASFDELIRYTGEQIREKWELYMACEE